ncbi:multicopper oxidase domain-containing protein [Paenibacillus brasilensis]|uniref:multicopper oxidase domain-containing protein n=1 Tax=Paenibacillus brasilensis TaxID=128574 RepID=UPI001FCC2678|nr:multicopper oxidase domain-containing protein [Paenibacillus brasilensis]
MVITPYLQNLSFSERNGVKYFELVAEHVKQELLPGSFINALGYNGSSPGPTIIVHPGDYVQIRVHNQLSEPTSTHWHWFRCS